VGNAEIQWKQLFPACKKALEKLKKENKNPDEINKKYRIVYNTKRKRYEFSDNGIKKAWKRLRRFLPEFKNKGDKDQVIPGEIWAKIWPFVENSFWKVQIGIVTWFALVVEGSPWETSVLELLKKAGLA